MMRIVLRSALVALCLLVFQNAFAQDKSLAYYNSHESEILPDAQAAFKDGNYDRVAELCKWHAIIVGDSNADDLRDKAQQCAKLTIELDAFLSIGQYDAAAEKAKEILALNPDDQKAKESSIYDPAKGKANGHEWVDLGLSVKWASCNIGASSPEEYGDYFAWGETSTKRNYSWRTYKFNSGGNDLEKGTFSKYNSTRGRGPVDRMTELELTDDAARSNWGGGWRMPSIREIEELVSNCTCEWVEQAGVNGYRFTSTRNGKSIFIPAAGFRFETSARDIGYKGFYWSISRTKDSPASAFCLYFQAPNPTYSYSTPYPKLSTNDYAGRDDGFTIRPVID